MKKKLLVILGPTSTGKTDLALSLAKKLKGELISADSRQVYKHLDIGTGKLPSNESRIINYELREGHWVINGIKIWMYDVIPPDEKFNLYQYILKAQEIIQKISMSGKLTILVGGTGLYIRSLLEGISDFGNGENSSLRQELANLETTEIRNKIEKINPENVKYLNNSEIHNKRRLIRLYEKLIAPKKATSFSGIGKRFDILKIGLKTERTTLRERIKQRVLKRMNQGMINESKRLLEDGILTYQRMEELGLEYKYIGKFLKGEIKTLKDLNEILSLKISQYAKRQETWFRKEKDTIWFDITKSGFKHKVEKTVTDWYN